MINVTDLETCGWDAGVVEIACVVVGDTIEFTEDGYMQSLVRPDCPIGPEAMGTHHITEEMVGDAPTLDAIILKYGLDVHDIWAAHNAEFDKKFFPERIREKKWIDTWRCALHLWPEAPSYKNQALRYWLNLNVEDMPASAGVTPHRALYDAWVTAKLLAKMIEIIMQKETGGPCLVHPDLYDELKSRAIEHLLKLSSEPVVLKRVTFGKHRDMQWSDVDRGYMRWCLKQDFDKDVIHTCKHYLGILV